MNRLARAHIIKPSPRWSGIDTELMDFVADCERTLNVSMRWSKIRDFLADQGVSRPCYMYMNPTAPEDQSTILADMPRWWADFYLDTQAAARDPFFKTCASLSPRLTGVSFLPENAPMLTQGEISFIHEASETGLTSGFAQPVRTIGAGHFGGWHLGTELPRHEFERLINEQSQRWQLVSFLFHRLIQEAACPSRADEMRNDNQVSLTPRERECLTWLADGLRPGQIADHLGLAKVTVDMHLTSARRKLRATTREQTLALAFKQGLISL